MTVKRILVAIPMEEEQKEMIRSLAPDYEVDYISDQETGNSGKDPLAYGIVIGNMPIPWIKQAANLKWVQLFSAGSDAYAKPGVLPEGCILTNSTGAFGLAISEHMIGMVLEIQKRLYQYLDDQRKHLWTDEGTVTSIYGSTTLVVGLGDIGTAFGTRMKALGSHVIGVKRTKSEKPDWIDELYTFEDLDSLLGRADIVSLSLPQTPVTNHMFDERRLRLMKHSAILINVGRGSAINTDALIRVMKDGHLMGAGLDVTEPEPLPADHPLWDVPNVIITPHISGYFHLQETLERIRRNAIANLEAYMAGKTMRNIVDFETGYRKS